jgi:hypothetical protein
MAAAYTVTFAILALVWGAVLVHLIAVRHQEKLKREIREAMDYWELRHNAEMGEFFRREDELAAWLESVGVTGLAARLRRAQGYSRSGKH